MSGKFSVQAQSNHQQLLRSKYEMNQLKKERNSKAVKRNEITDLLAFSLFLTTLSKGSPRLQVIEAPSRKEIEAQLRKERSEQAEQAFVDGLQSNAKQGDFVAQVALKKAGSSDVDALLKVWPSVFHELSGTLLLRTLVKKLFKGKEFESIYKAVSKAFEKFVENEKKKQGSSVENRLKCAEAFPQIVSEVFQESSKSLTKKQVELFTTRLQTLVPDFEATLVYRQFDSVADQYAFLKNPTIEVGASKKLSEALGLNKKDVVEETPVLETKEPKPFPVSFNAVKTMVKLGVGIYALSSFPTTLATSSETSLACAQGLNGTIVSTATNCTTPILELQASQHALLDSQSQQFESTTNRFQQKAFAISISQKSLAVAQSNVRTSAYQGFVSFLSSFFNVDQSLSTSFNSSSSDNVSPTVSSQLSDLSSSLESSKSTKLPMVQPGGSLYSGTVDVKAKLDLITTVWNNQNIPALISSYTSNAVVAEGLEVVKGFVATALEQGFGKVQAKSSDLTTPLSKEAAYVQSLNDGELALTALQALVGDIDPTAIPFKAIMNELALRLGSKCRDDKQMHSYLLGLQACVNGEDDTIQSDKSSEKTKLYWKIAGAVLVAVAGIFLQEIIRGLKELGKVFGKCSPCCSCCPKSSHTETSRLREDARKLKKAETDLEAVLLASKGKGEDSIKSSQIKYINRFIKALVAALPKPQQPQSESKGDSKLPSNNNNSSTPLNDSKGSEQAIELQALNKASSSAQLDITVGSEVSDKNS